MDDSQAMWRVTARMLSEFGLSDVDEAPDGSHALFRGVNPGIPSKSDPAVD